MKLELLCMQFIPYTPENMVSQLRRKSGVLTVIDIRVELCYGDTHVHDVN